MRGAGTTTRKREGMARAGVLAFRFLAGHNLNGTRPTNATFRKPATSVIGPYRVGRWAHLPGFKRAGIRLTVLLVVLAMAYGWIRHTGAMPGTLRLLFWMSLPVLVVAAWNKGRMWQHTAQYHEPLARWYSATFGVPLHDARARIDIPREHLDDPAAMSTVRMPHGYTLPATEAAQRKQAAAIYKKLGMPDADVELDMTGQPTYVIRCAPKPPPIVGYGDVRDYLATSTVENMFMALGGRDTPVYVSWLGKTPHVGLTCTTGLGKSTIARWAAMQFLRHGHRVVIFDMAKGGESHGEWTRYADGSYIPGVELYRTDETVHDGLIAWDNERLRRSTAQFDRTGEEPQRVLIVLEEMNIMIDDLRTHWNKTKERGDPFRSPAIDALRRIACAGRSTYMHCLVVAQKLSAAASGGEAVRENLGAIMFGNASHRTVKNVSPDARPIPRKIDHPGRVTLVVGDTSTEMQVPFSTDSEAREYATSGVPQPDVPVRPPDPPRPPVSLGPPVSGEQDAVAVPQQRTAALTSVTGGNYPEGLLSLRQAVTDGVLSCSLAVAKWGRAHDPRFPSPRERVGQTHLYHPDDLTGWEANRSVRQ